LGKAIGIVLYNLGRAVTYASLGLVFGFLGNQFRLWGLQQIVSITAGFFLLLFLLSNFSFTSRIKWLAAINQRVQQGLGRLLKSSNRPTSLFPIGLLNGLLPCGLVYVAIAAALATTDTLQGVLLMFAFGLGTLPVMAGLMAFGHMISVTVRQKINRAVPYMIGMMAIVLILRGMNLGIPYVSPKLEKHATEVDCCHRPGSQHNQ
jgi:sulfite exporter TauE/SafE